MADSVIGAIRAILQLDTVAFSQGAKEAESSLASLEKKFTSTAKSLAAGLGVGLGVKQFTDSIKKMIDQADELGKASQKFGVPVEQLSALKFAAELADVSFEQLGKGLAKLSKAILDGAVNPSGEAAKTFKSLGISVRDANGQIKPTEQIFSDIAEKFSTMEDGAGKTATAIKLFGRSGAELIPLLNEGRSGIKKLTDEAKSLGIVISADTAAKAQEFNDTLKRIHTTGDAVYLQFAEQLLPTLQKLADMFLQARKEGDGLKSLFADMSVTLQTDLEDVQKGVVVFEALAKVWALIKTLSPTDSLSQVSAKLAEITTDMKNKIAAVQASFLSLGKAGAFDSLENLPEILAKIKRGMGGLDEDALKVKTSIDKWIDSQKRQAEAQTAANQIINGSVGIMETSRFQSELDNKTLEEKTKLTDAQTAAAQRAKDAVLQAAQTGAIKGFILETENEYDKLTVKIQQVGELMGVEKDKAQQLAKAQLQFQQAQTNLLVSGMATAAGQFGQLFMQLGQKNKELFAIGKAFAIAEAVMNTYVAANKALAAYPPPFSFIAAAAAVAAGIANVIKIQSTKMPSAAAGGSFRVPGGMMGVDTGIFPMKLAPGELIDVTPASQAAGGGDRTLNIPAINSRDFFTGDTVRDMVAAIDQWMKDGGSGVRVQTAGVRT
jgi:Phage-related minor tail protein